MRSSMPVLVAAVALGLTAGCQTGRSAERGAPVDPTLAVAQAEWREAETEHVIVWTDLAEGAAKQMAHELEWFRRAMLLVWGPDVNPPEKMRVIVVRSQQELAAFGADRYRGAYSTTPLGPHLFLAAEGGYLLGDSAATESLTKHELAHAVMHRVLRHQPRWVAEGLANYLETIHVQADGNVIIGRADVQSLATVRGSGRIPLSTLLAWEDDTGLRESDLGAHYSTAWAWVHFLFNSYPDAFVAYLQLLQQGSAEEAWAATLGGQVPADQLERELSIHLAQGRGVLVTVPFPGIKDAVALRPLSPSNVQVAVSLLHLAVPGRPKEARMGGAQAAAAKAVELDEKNASAQRLLGALTGSALATPRSGPGEEGTATVSTRECPADIVREDGLEQALSLRAGAWVPEITPSIFWSPPVEAAPPPHQVDATLTSGKVSLVSASQLHGATVAILRDVGEGACVVNTWSTLLPATQLRAVSHWVSKDRKLAVYLLHLRDAPKDKPATSRWVALTTDGTRVWPALGGGGGLHFLAKSAKLRPQSGKLYLDVIVKGPGGIVFALRENGRFEQLGAQR